VRLQQAFQGVQRVYEDFCYRVVYSIALQTSTNMSVPLPPILWRFVVQLTVYTQPFGPLHT